jgi:hypothetical protein
MFLFLFLDFLSDLLDFIKSLYDFFTPKKDRHPEMKPKKDYYSDMFLSL